jgi:hypothetical protein
MAVVYWSAMAVTISLSLQAMSQNTFDKTLTTWAFHSLLVSRMNRPGFPGDSIT